MRYVLLSLVAIGMMTYALIDCVRTDDTRIRMGLPKAFWVIAIIVVPIAGALTWLIISGLNRRKINGGPAARPSKPKPPPAPDDDPDFLFRLERDRRRAQKERDAAEGPRRTPPASSRRTDPPTGEADQPRTGAGHSEGNQDHDEPDRATSESEQSGTAEERSADQQDRPDDDDLLYIPEDFQDLPLPRDLDKPETPEKPGDEHTQAGEDESDDDRGEGRTGENSTSWRRADEDDTGRH